MSFIVLGILAIGATVFVWWNGGVDTNTDEPAQTHTSEASAMESWVRYESEVYDFSFAYPNDWYLNDDEGGYALVSVSPMSPDDPRRPSSASLYSTFFVGLFEEESVTSHIQTITDNPYNEGVVSSEIVLDSGVTVPFVTYGNAYGARVNESFITLHDDTILRVWFGGPQEICLEILRSFEWR